MSDLIDREAAVSLVLNEIDGAVESRGQDVLLTQIVEALRALPTAQAWGPGAPVVIDYEAGAQRMAEMQDDDILRSPYEYAVGVIDAAVKGIEGGKAETVVP